MLGSSDHARRDAIKRYKEFGPKLIRKFKKGFKVKWKNVDEDYIPHLELLTELGVLSADRSDNYAWINSGNMILNPTFGNPLRYFFCDQAHAIEYAIGKPELKSARLFKLVPGDRVTV